MRNVRPTGIRARRTSRAILERRTIHVDDILEEFAQGNYLEARGLQQASGFRTVLVVPLMREDAVIGVITIRRLEMSPFTAKQIALLKTFADQAVIAIENVRLFTELQASNRELTTALDTQTATSDILRVISRSQTDVQPVFDAIVASAVRLLGGVHGRADPDRGRSDRARRAHEHRRRWRRCPEGALPTVAPLEGARPGHSRSSAAQYRRRPHRSPIVPEAGHAYARVRGYRSWVVVPMLRHDEAVGTIAVTRREPGGFTDDEIALLQTFADQAVIAIENARLFSELQASEPRAQHVARWISRRRPSEILARHQPLTGRTFNRCSMRSWQRRPLAAATRGADPVRGR